jgi:hypothetical protein
MAMNGLLHQMQEVLADAADLSLVLLKPDQLRLSMRDPGQPFAAFEKQVCVCPWSNPEGFVDLLRKEPQGLHGFVAAVRQ